MRKLILFDHVSLDGYAASGDRSLDWIYTDDEIFDYASKAVKNADTALYGRVTYELMQAYWPSAGDKYAASKHDKEHSAWYNSVKKIVISNSIRISGEPNTRFISGDIAGQVREQKGMQGMDILMLGSPTAAHVLIEQGLIDEYRLFINPVLLGGGIPLFPSLEHLKKLKLAQSKVFSCKVAGLFYENA